MVEYLTWRGEWLALSSNTAYAYLFLTMTALEAQQMIEYGHGNPARVA